MLYTKDEKKYVEMCQIFDKEFYEEDRDNAKLFKYLYLIFYMLACKENYSRNSRTTMALPSWRQQLSM